MIIRSCTVHYDTPRSAPWSGHCGSNVPAHSTLSPSALLTIARILHVWPPEHSPSQIWPPIVVMEPMFILPNVGLNEWGHAFWFVDELFAAPLH